VLGAPSRPLLWKESENLLALGSKIMNNEAEPLIYVERADEDAPKIMKTSSRKKVRAKSYKKRRYSRDIRTVRDSDRYEGKKRPDHQQI
jgi:ribulose kinase